MRQRNEPIADIAALFRVDRSTISRLCYKLPRKRVVKDGYKYSSAEVENIRTLYSLGMTEVALAAMYDTRPQVISLFVTGAARGLPTVSKGHKGERNPLAKLTAQQVLWARSQPDTVKARDDIAEKLGITGNYATILVRKNSRVWRHV